MHTKRVAIVLRQLDSLHKIALLDRDVGRIDGIVSFPIGVGSLISYVIEKRLGTWQFIRHVEVKDVPFAVARLDLLFWHHVLELCYYFVPAGSFTFQLFELLEFLYTVDKGTCWRTGSKKLYIFKLLILIGVYAKLPALPGLEIKRLQAIPFDMIANEVIDEQTEEELDLWLRTCVYEHPAIKKFNTVHFLLPK